VVNSAELTPSSSVAIFSNCSRRKRLQRPNAEEAKVESWKATYPRGVTVLLSVVSLVLASCTAEPAASSPPPAASGDGSGEAVTLNILHYQAGGDSKAEPMADALAAFAEQYPNITVEEQTADSPDSLATLYETASVAGEEPDIVITNLFGKTTSWLENGATVPVTDFIGEWGLEETLLPEAVAQWTTAEGEVQAFPFEGFTWPTWYNTAILEQAGVGEPPTTTDDLIAAAEALRAAGFEPFVTGGSDWNGNKLFSLILQMFVPSDEAIELFSNGGWSESDTARQGIELFVELRDAGTFADSVEGFTVDSMGTAFYGGEAAMMSNGAWAYAGTPPEVSENVFLGGFPLPPDAVVDKPLVYNGWTSTAFWISPNGAEKLDAVESFITFFYQPEILADYVTRATISVPVDLESLPVDTSTLDPLYIQASTEMQERTESAVLQDAYVPAAADSAFTRATSLAYTPGTSVDEIIEALDQAYQP
jgi:multiple sugar transport system substrate-binding protein